MGDPMIPPEQLAIDLHVLPRVAAARKPADALLAVVDPSETAARQAGLCHTVTVHDIPDDPIDPAEARDLRAMGLSLPGPDTARGIIAFADRLKRELAPSAPDTPLTVVVHCSAGVSRSPAAALGLLARLSGLAPDDPAQPLLDYLVGTGCRDIAPNAALLAHLDAVLGLPGSLRRLVETP